MKPPMLHLANPASATPVVSRVATPVQEHAPRVHAAMEAGPAPASGQRGAVQVDLISSAFLVQPGRDCGEASTSSFILGQCTQQLGVAPEEFTLYELRPLQDGIVNPSCSHVGVSIRASAFSLGALEDMLKRSRRDEHLTTMLDGALKDNKQQTERLAKQELELAIAREQLQRMEAENQHLRDQLRRSEEQRQLLGQELRSSKHKVQDIRSRVQPADGKEQAPTAQQAAHGAGLHLNLPSEAQQQHLSGMQRLNLNSPLERE